MAPMPAAGLPLRPTSTARLALAQIGGVLDLQHGMRHGRIILVLVGDAGAPGFFGCGCDSCLRGGGCKEQQGWDKKDAHRGTFPQKHRPRNWTAPMRRR